MKACASLAWCGIAVSVLAGCGGGGGDPPPPPPPPATYAVRAALANLLTVGGSWTVSGTASDGSAYSLTFGFAPAASAPFPVSGEMAERSIETVSTNAGGVDLGSSTLTYYFHAADLAFVGIAADDGTCSSMSSNTALPATASPGASGALYAENDYDNCSGGTVPPDTTVGRWSLETDAAVNLLCWTQVTPGPPAAPLATISYCFEVAADGALGSKARVSVSSAAFSPPFSLTARNF